MSRYRTVSVQCATRALLLSAIIASAVLNGCATYRSLDSLNSNSPVFFSGARMDVNAMMGNTIALRRYDAPPPRYPLLDLPASLLLDLLFSPATGSLAVLRKLGS